MSSDREILLAEIGGIILNALPGLPLVQALELRPKSPDKWWFRRDSASDYYQNGMCMSGFGLASRRVPT